jgi:hypothetical protein
VNRGSGAQGPFAQSFIAVSAPADTNEDTLATINVPALGANSLIRIHDHLDCSPALAARERRARALQRRLGDQVFRERGRSGSQVGLTLVTYIANANATNSQVGSSIGQIDNGTGVQTAGAGNATSAVDTTVGTTIVLTGQKASAGDTSR